MYEIFKENRELLTRAQIKEKYKGKWVFLINLQGPFFQTNENGEVEPCEWSSGEVLIISDWPYDTGEDNIWEELKSNREHYGVTGEIDLRSGNRIPSNYYVIEEGGFC